MRQSLGCVRVLQSTIAIRELWGKFDAVLEPGCHLIPCCFGKTIAGFLSLHVQQLDLRCDTKTEDNAFVTVVVSIQYRALAKDAQDAFYMLSNTKQHIQSYVFDADLDDAFQKKNEIANAVKEELQKAMAMYGYEIVGTLIVDIELDAQLKEAINDLSVGKFLDFLK